MNGLLELKLGSYSLIESKSKKQLILRLPTTNARRCALLAWWGDSGYHNLDIIAARCGYEIKNHTMPWLMHRRVRLLRWKYCNNVNINNI